MTTGWYLDWKGLQLRTQANGLYEFSTRLEYPRILVSPRTESGAIVSCLLTGIKYLFVDLNTGRALQRIGSNLYGSTSADGPNATRWSLVGTSRPSSGPIEFRTNIYETETLRLTLTTEAGQPVQFSCRCGCPCAFSQRCDVIGNCFPEDGQSTDPCGGCPPGKICQPQAAGGYVCLAGTPPECPVPDENEENEEDWPDQYDPPDDTDPEDTDPDDTDPDDTETSLIEQWWFWMLVVIALLIMLGLIVWLVKRSK